jgi:hypothetical protein
MAECRCRRLDGSPLVKHAHEGNRAQGQVAADPGDRLRHSYSLIGEVRLFTLASAVHI